VQLVDEIRCYVCTRNHVMTRYLSECLKIISVGSLQLFVATFVLFISFYQTAKGTHIVGGDLHYEYLGDNEYLIVLKVYRDCATSSTDFDNPAAIGIYDDAGNLVENVEVLLADAIVSDVPVNLLLDCLTPPDGLCVKEAIFSATVTLPPIPGGYTLAYQRCCRNTTLVNTESNDDLGMTLFAEIPGTDIEWGNSNPSFNEYPPIVICLNQPFIFDHSATDLDGDELVYEFCNPLLTNVGGFYINPPGPPPYPELIFIDGYTYQYPIASDPAFSIDSSTGLITGTPNQLGQYVVGICVKEYRNGELIACTNRDFQFNVTLCEMDVVASIPEQENLCDGLSAQFENSSLNANSYFWDFGVLDSEEDTSSLFEPFFAYPDTGTYVITLIANPGTLCADTAYGLFYAYPSILAELFFEGSNCLNGEMVYDFSATVVSEADAEYEWNFGAGSSPQFSTQQNPIGITLNPNSESILVSFTLFDNGCEVTDTMTIYNPPDPIAGIVPQEAYCEGFTYTFENDSENSETYMWNFGTTENNDNSFEENPEWTFPGGGEYIVTLIAMAPNSCPDTTTLNFSIYGLLEPYFAPQLPQCFDGNSFDFIAMGASTDIAEYSWSFGPNASPSNTLTPNVFDVNYSTNGTFAVTLTISENNCTESYTDSVEIILNPVISIDFEGAQGCPPLIVQFENESIAETPLYFMWTFGDGSVSYEPSPEHIYYQTGLYDVTLLASTASGCIVSYTEVMQNAVTVYPLPNPGFNIDPQTVNILDPLVAVENASSDLYDCYYLTSDGASYTDCDFQHAFTQSGQQWIQQFVTNEYGCVSNVIGYVNVEGFTFFAPNSFTPNQDGVNDVWMPVSTGITEYKLQIFDRWGTIIFETDDSQQAWTGSVHGGEHFAQDGVYQWQVTFRDLMSLAHEFNGHIALIR
jgi:gliding motility-associated-like protein